MPTFVRRVSVTLGPNWTPCAVPPSVLLLTEDSDVRAVIARVLRREGYSVMAAAHTGHAILVSTQRSAFDVLIVEQRLADGHARAVVERLQEWNPNVRTLRLCDAGTSGPTALVRPFTADSLLEKLEALARRTATTRRRA